MAAVPFVGVYFIFTIFDRFQVEEQELDHDAQKQPGFIGYNTEIKRISTLLNAYTSNVHSYSLLNSFQDAYSNYGSNLAQDLL